MFPELGTRQIMPVFQDLNLENKAEKTAIQRSVIKSQLIPGLSNTIQTVVRKFIFHMQTFSQHEI